MLGAIRAWHLFAIALCIRLAVVALHHPTPAFTENVRAGFTLADKGYLGDPFAAPTGPTAHVAPVYPVIVAVGKSLAGTDGRTFLLLQVVGAVVASLNVALLLPVARAVGFPHLAGVFASLLWMPPWFRWIELSGEHESIYTTLATLLLLRIAVPRLRQSSLSLTQGAVFGGAIGLAAHFSPVLVPAGVLMGIAGIRLLRSTFTGALLFGLAGAIAFLMTIAPYTWRNYRAMNSLFAVRDNLGLELAVSNGPSANAVATRNLERGSGMNAHPYVSVAEAEKVRAMGEVAYNRSRQLEALAWIRSNPGRFATLTLQRAGRFLFPYSPRLYQSIVGAFITFLFVLGALWLPPASKRTAWTLGAFVIGYSGIYLFVQHDMRYWYPMLWVQSLVAGVMIGTAWFKLSSTTPSP